MLIQLLLPALLLTQAGEPAKPEWLTRLPEVPGRLYAMGSADLGGTDAQARTRAADRARLEVVARLRSSVKGSTSVLTRTTEAKRDGQAVYGSGDRTVRDEVTVAAQAVDLPGLVVEQTFLDTTGRAAYALAYLDVAQAQAGLTSRLATVRDGRNRIGEERTRKARWRYRKLKSDLDRLDDLVGLLAGAGLDPDVKVQLQKERAVVDQRLAKLEAATLPPLDYAKTALSFDTNADLPPGVEAYVKAQITLCGLLTRDMDPDLVLEVTFQGGSKGPEFIYSDIDLYAGVTYRLDAEMRLKDPQGGALTRAIPIHLAQGGSPEGMVTQFRKQLERWLPRLLGEFKNEMQ